MADPAPRLPGRRRDPAPRVPRSASRRAGRAAAAGVLLIAVVAAGCSDDDDAAAPATTTTEATTTTTETPPRPTTTTVGVPALVDPAETARAWIAEIGGGDDEDAIALTSPRSLDAVGGAEGFREREIELAEGWGAWDVAEDLDVQTVAVSASLAIVVLHGRVPHEGPPEEAWAAMPVVATEDGDRVEPFLDLGAVEADPPANTTIEPAGRLRAYVPSGREVRFVLDAQPAVEPALQGVDGDRQLAELDVADLPPGRHALTVVVFDDGGVMARTFEYTVAG